MSEEVMMADKRQEAVEAYVQSMKSGEVGASERASKCIAADAVLVAGNQEVSGHDAVLARVTGQWPQTPVYTLGGWSAPEPDGDRLKVHADFPAMGAAVKEVNLTFSFNAKGEISRVEQQNVMPAPMPPSDKIPDFIKGLLNGALANGTPIVVAYVNENGQPSQSLRGSTQVFSDNQLSIWVRAADSGITRAIAKNPNVSLLYRDSKVRTTLIVQGRAHVDSDPSVRERVFNLIPEVEQNHDPGAVKGAAVIIDVDRIQGGSGRGAFRMERTPVAAAGD
jgi:uncharacterized pyridoxamine 5'-phosphate oxidase family protein